VEVRRASRPACPAFRSAPPQDVAGPAREPPLSGPSCPGGPDPARNPAGRGRGTDLAM